MQIIPLLAVPSQTLTVQLGTQPCTLNVYQMSTGLYIDVYVNDKLIIGGVIGRDADRIARDAYLGFIGDLSFYDTQGLTDPVYTGLGQPSANPRYILAYLDPTDLATAGLVA